MDQHSDPQYKTDDGSALRIWQDVAQNNFLTEKHGRPIFDEVLYVEVISPGSGNSTPIFEAMRTLAPEAGRLEPKYGIKYEEFKKFIKDFLAGEASDVSMTGTPLSQWPEMTRTMVASLKVAKIFTVDALAVLPDNKLPVVGPDGRTWRTKAQAYLDNAKSGAFATQLAAQLDRAIQDKADLQGQIAALSEQVRAMQEKAGELPEPGKAAIAQPVVIPPPIDQAALETRPLEAII
jgi:hypothetical protein